MPDGSIANKTQAGVTTLDALIIGAGFSGLYQLLSLRDKLGMKAKVVEAESEVPLAMAEAFKKGNLGVLDYYKLDNIASDTSMRQSIAGVTDDKKEVSED